MKTKITTLGIVSLMLLLAAPTASAQEQEEAAIEAGCALYDGEEYTFCVQVQDVNDGQSCSDVCVMFLARQGSTTCAATYKFGSWGECVGPIRI